MNKKIGLLVSGTMLLLVTNSASAAITNGLWEGYKPYVGVDAAVRRMDFKGGYGDNLLQHHSPQGNIYAGVKFNDSVGVEAGYEATTTRTRASTLTTGDIGAGTLITAATSPIVFKSKAKIKGPHIDLVGFYSFAANLPVQLLGSVGVSLLKGTYERKTIQMGNPPIQGRNRTLSDHKAVLRLMGGIQYMWDCNLGARATVGLVKTGKMIIYANDGIASAAIPAIKPKDSTVYGLGMFWVF
jgi:hypothetical protein